MIARVSFDVRRFVSPQRGARRERRRTPGFVALVWPRARVFVHVIHELRRGIELATARDARVRLTPRHARHHGRSVGVVGVVEHLRGNTILVVAVVAAARALCRDAR